MSGHDRPLTPAEIAAGKDENIDFSDVPEMDDAFWRQANLIEPDRTEPITQHAKRSVLAHFRAPSKS